MPPNVHEELGFRLKQAKTAICAWKSHLLRSVNQDMARMEVLVNLDQSSVLLVQDWAGKYLPRKYRESQADWFGKRGIPWHITVATRKNAGEMQMLTLVHIFPGCSQDSCAVLAVMADVIKQLKSTMPELRSVYYRQDNAGCYHCGATIAGAKVLGEAHGIVIRRLDFSDPQGGKGPCDRKAATIKSHMRIYLNSGNDIETPYQIKDAILSSGGVDAVNLSLCQSITSSKLQPIKIDNVSLLNNFQYEDEGVRVWRAYGIGPGKLLKSNKFQYPTLRELPSVDVTCSFRNTFTAVKQRSSKDTPEDDEVGIKPDDEPEAAVFTCHEEGCTQTFLRHSSLQRHLDCGKHKRTLERETLLDRAARAYSEALEGQTTAVPQISTMVVTKPDSSDNFTKLAMGWALKSGASRKRFSEQQKNYLDGKFRVGEQSGRKADPASVARAMMTAKDVNGQKLFTSDEYLTASQVNSYFSRLAAKKSLPDNDGYEDQLDDTQNASYEAQIEELTKRIVGDLGPTHPITHGAHNLCEIVLNSNLTKFSISILQEICESLGIETADITSVRRKQPYVETIEGFCLGCTCRQ